MIETMRIAPSLVRELAHEAGFELVRFGPADPGPFGARFASWLDAGRAGEMQYLHDNRARILDPVGTWAASAVGSVALAHDYGGPAVALQGGGRIARYAGGRDYHRYLGLGVERLRTRLEKEGTPWGTIKIGTDAVPILERALAVRAGIGFLAKSAGVISPTLGPWLLLSELLVPFELPQDGPAPGSCGTCTKCLDACPTGAITAPFEVDARKCLSYTTIELRGTIPPELREQQGEWLFGCDVCLEVCPFAERGRISKLAERPANLKPHPVTEQWTLVALLELDAERYEREWVGTAMRRATRDGLRRNAAVVLGNLGEPGAVPALGKALADPDPVLRAHSAWALGRLQGGRRWLDARLPSEVDPQVRDEIRAALARG